MGKTSNQINQKMVTTAKLAQNANNKVQDLVNQRYAKFEFYVDTKSANVMWLDEYGDMVAPLLVKSKDGETFVKQPNVSAWIHNQNFEKLLGSEYAYLPHGKTEQIADHIIHNDLAKEKIKLLKVEEAHRGHTKYWKYIGDETFKIDPKTDDEIKVGFVVRNGIGTGVALGVDVFTYRLVCSNGAVAKDKNLISVSIRHVGDIEKIQQEFVAAISQVMLKSKEIIRYYRKATEIKVNTEMANKMYQRMAKMGEAYLPENWNVLNSVELKKVMREGKFKNNLNLISVKKPISLWETFNEITANQRVALEGKKTSFPQIAKQQNILHQELFAIVNAKGGI